LVVLQSAFRKIPRSEAALRHMVNRNRMGLQDAVQAADCFPLVATGLSRFKLASTRTLNYVKSYDVCLGYQSSEVTFYQGLPTSRSEYVAS